MSRFILRIGKCAGVMFNILIAVYPCVKVSEVKKLSFAVPDIGKSAASYHLRNCPGGTGQIIPGLFNGNKAFSLNDFFIQNPSPTVTK